MSNMTVVYICAELWLWRVDYPVLICIHPQTTDRSSFRARSGVLTDALRFASDDPLPEATLFITTQETT